MHQRTARQLPGIAALAAALLGSGLGLSPTAVAQASAAVRPEDQPAEKVFHNIQVFKGMRAGDLQGAMSFIASSLGVDCDYCHRGDGNDFGKDATKEKSRAREMIQMVRQINEGTFHGENKVNCFTCHQGHKDPVSLAPITSPAPEPKTEGTAGLSPGGLLPSVDEVLDRYTQALGGKAALDGVKSRIIRTEPLGKSGGDPKTVSMTYQKAPAKVLVASESPSYSLWVGFDGQHAWAQDSLKSYWGILDTTERDSIMRDSELYPGNRIKAQYSKVKVARKEKVGGKDAFVIEGISPENTSEEFFFDAQTGLLLRRHIVEQTVFGGFQVQEDYQDYREVGGVKMPFVVKWSSPGDAWGTRISKKVVDVKQNEPIDDERFQHVPTSAQPGHTN